MARRALLPEDIPNIAVVDAGSEAAHADIAVVATHDPELIKRWAAYHHAEPATGEASPSGPAVVDVRDGDAGIRFNFPGVARYRPISWEEWLDHFVRHELAFIYERDPPGETPSARYRLVKTDTLRKRVADLVE